MSHSQPLNVDVQTLVRKQYRALHAMLGRLPERCGPQDVHKARVAVRRLRTILSEVAPAIAAPIHARLQRNLKSIADDLGAARDADVRCDILLPMLRNVDGAAVAAARIATMALRAERRKSRQQIQERLHSASLRKRLRTLDRLIDGGALFGQDTRADELFASASRRRWKKVARDIGKDIDKPAKLHALRIRVKKCRYLLDAQDIQTKTRGAKAYALLHDLQDCLGELNDLAQTRRWMKGQRLKSSMSKALIPLLRAREQQAKSRLKRLRRKFRRARRIIQ